MLSGQDFALSHGKMQFPEQGVISRVGMQGLEQWIGLYFADPRVMSGVRTVEPGESTVRFAAECENAGNLILAVGSKPSNQFAQRCVGLLLVAGRMACKRQAES